MFRQSHMFCIMASADVVFPLGMQHYPSPSFSLASERHLQDSNSHRVWRQMEEKICLPHLPHISRSCKYISHFFFETSEVDQEQVSYNRRQNWSVFWLFSFTASLWFFWKEGWGLVCYFPFSSFVEQLHVLL